MNKYVFSLLLIVCQLSSFCSASEIKTYKGVISGGYDFYVSTPTTKSDTAAKPMVVFLHGASLCGTNIERVRRYGVLNAVDRGMRIPAIVVAPQNPGGAWRPSKVNDVMMWVERNYSVDTSRVYVIGMSLGGYGTLDFVNAYPDKVAAAMALCGGCSMKCPAGLSKVPLWVMHGTADRAVALSKSREVVNYLKGSKADSLLRYDWISGANHGYLARFFYLKKTYDWLLAHSLSDTPRVVNRKIDISRQEMNSAYR